MKYKIFIIFSLALNYSFGAISVGVSQIDFNVILQDLIADSNPNQTPEETISSDQPTNNITNIGNPEEIEIDENGDLNHPIPPEIPPDNPPEIPTNDDDSNNTNDTSSPPSGSGVFDTDDDVPTLLSIRSKIHTLQQEMVKQTMDLRGNTIVKKGESEESKDIALSDILDALNNQAEIEEYEEEKEQNEEQSDQTEEKLETFDEKINEVVDKLDIDVSVPSGASSLNTMFEIDAGNHNFYIDPFNDVINGESLFNFTWQELADWISLLVGLYAVWVWWVKGYGFINQVLQQLSLINFTSPVSNVSIFGNSIGTLKLMAIRLTFIWVLFGFTLANMMLVLAESNFSVGGAVSNVIDILTGTFSLLSGEAGIMADAVNLFLSLIPIASIIAMVTQFFGIKLATWLFIATTTSTSKAVT